MRAPEDQPRALDEIVRDLAHSLIVENSDADAVEVDVRATIRTGQTLFPRPTSPPLWGYRSDNLESIKAVRKQISGLQNALKKLPERALFLLFAPEVSGIDDQIPSIALQKRIEGRAQNVVTMLAALSARCDEMIGAEPGKHKLVGHREEWAAVEAYRLLRRHNKKPSKTNSADSLFRETASLLLEAITGKPGVDLERHCRAVFDHEWISP